MLLRNICIGMVLLLLACNEAGVPKPRGYFKIELPEKSYRVFDEPGYPYTFEYPSYGSVVKDSTFFDDKPENPWWVNVDFPGFRAKIYISYKPVNGTNKLELLVRDAFEMTSKHSVKATSIDEIPVKGGPGVQGFIFDVGGNAATGKQFFVTDSSRHFLRGALYFDATPNYDSIQPVEQFLYKDMQRLIETLRWRNG